MKSNPQTMMSPLPEIFPHAAPLTQFRPSMLDEQTAIPLADRFGRIIDHLRLSVTSVCNLRCLYCRPQHKGGHRPVTMSDKQRLELIQFFHKHYGLKQLRLTGGEPLLHPTITRLIALIRRTMPDLSLAMTTNACHLAPVAAELRSAGLDRLNISLDSISHQTFRGLTGGDVSQVLDGIDRAMAVGFPPPRVNSVVLAGINDSQLTELAAWAISHRIEIRFLEAMPIGPAAVFNRDHFVTAKSIKNILKTRFVLSALPRMSGETAERFTADDGSIKGTVGIIAPVTLPFCGQCRRVRVTADGRLYPCLLDSRFVDLSDCWHSDCFHPARADELIRSAVAAKHAQGSLEQTSEMIRLGG